MSKKIPGMGWIFIGFIPWILYWVLSGPGLWTAAVTAGLASALALNAYRFRQRLVRTMELVTLGFFAAHFAATVVLGLPFFKVYDAMLVGATLAAMAWGTLLAGSPFTYQYAREDWPREYWDNPLFRRTNEIITAVWGIVFTVNAVLGALAPAFAARRPEGETEHDVVVVGAGIGGLAAAALLARRGLRVLVA
jgi:hypothetical protein